MFAIGTCSASVVPQCHDHCKPGNPRKVSWSFFFSVTWVIVYLRLCCMGSLKQISLLRRHYRWPNTICMCRRKYHVTSDVFISVVSQTLELIVPESHVTQSSSKKKHIRTLDVHTVRLCVSSDRFLIIRVFCHGCMLLCFR